MAGRKKGSKKTGGRKKGVTNKITQDLKAMILRALDESGGVNYLKSQALLTPTAFISLIGKVLPTTLANDKDNPLLVPMLQIVMNESDSNKTSR